jgi:hypothetical protein
MSGTTERLRELAACPFCDGKPMPGTWLDPSEKNVGVRWMNPKNRVVCACSAEGPRGTSDAAIAAWNNRPTIDHLTAALAEANARADRMREALQQLADCIEPVLPPPEHEAILVPIAPTILGHTQAQTTSTHVKLSVRGKDLWQARKSLTAARQALATLPDPHKRAAALSDLNKLETKP